MSFETTLNTPLPYLQDHEKRIKKDKTKSVRVGTDMGLSQ